MSRNRPMTDFPRNEAGLVDQFIGTAYDTVKVVADNLDLIVDLSGQIFEIPELAANAVSAELATQMPPIRAELQGYVDQSESSAVRAEQAAVSAAKVNLMFPFVFNGSQSVFDVTVISGRSDITTAGMALWIEGAIDYNFVINNGTVFTLTDVADIPYGAAMKLIINARYDDLIHNLDQLGDAMQAEFDADQSTREAEFNDFLAHADYEVPVPYVATLNITRPSQTVTYLGYTYRVDTVYIPLVTSNWSADAPKMKLVGDNKVRDELANPTDPALGAGMLGRASVSIASVMDLLAAKQDASQLYCVAAYYPGVYALASPSAGLGSNQFKWAPLVPRSAHNGGTIISPTVPWVGTQTTVAAFLLKTGETQPAATGCFVAINRQQINVGQFGASGISTDDQTQSLLSAIAAAPSGGELIFPLGIFTTAQMLLVTKSLNIYGLGATVNVSLRYTGTGYIPTLKIDAPDAGSIRSIGFWSSLNNGPQLHVTNTAHMWHLDTLLFRSCPGTALRVDNVTWDFHWRNIDILSCGSDTTLAPVDGAALVVGGVEGTVNNAHFSMLRIEQAKNASIYWNASGTINGGKCDRGFIAGATQPSVIVAPLGRGQVTFTDYYLGGSAGQYEVEHRSGELKFVTCLLDRPTTLDGIVKLALTRYHNKADVIAYSFFEPRTGRLTFDACTLKGAHVSVSGTTRGVVTGVAANNVLVDNNVVASSAYNGGGNYTEVKLVTNSSFPSNNWLDRAFLVNATTGAKAKITTSFSTGGIRLATNRVADFPVAATVRVEYFANDEEFVAFRGNTFENIQPFDIQANALAISAPSYSGATFLTSAILSGTVTTGYAGYFLVNQTTGRRWKILSHVASSITLHYDVAAQLGVGDVYSVMAAGGYSVNTDGVTASWVYANTTKTKAVSELSRLGRTISDIILNMD